MATQQRYVPIEQEMLEVVSKVSPVHTWKENDNTESSQTTRSNNEETTTEYSSMTAKNVTQFTEI